MPDDYGGDPIEVFEDGGRAVVRLVVILACFGLFVAFCAGFALGRFG